MFRPSEASAAMFILSCHLQCESCCLGWYSSTCSRSVHFSFIRGHTHLQVLTVQSSPNPSQDKAGCIPREVEGEFSLEDDPKPVFPGSMKTKFQEILEPVLSLNRLPCQIVLLHASWVGQG